MSKTKRLHLHRSERGIATVIAILMVGILTLVGLVAMNSSNDEVSIAGNNLNATRSFYAAEAGLEVASAAIQASYDSTGAPPSTMPSGSITLNGATATYGVTDNGAASQKTLTQGALAGLNALAKTYSLTSSGVSNASQTSADLTMTFEADLIPLFQFAVFYQNDCEIAPGPFMTLSGRVHCNSNLWLQSDNGLDITSNVTTAGNLKYGRKTTVLPTGTGDVRIKNAAGSFVSMKVGSSWVDHDYPSWATTATSMWNGKVQDVAHGMNALNLPLSSSGTPHKIIEPATSNPDSYENKATLKIVNNVAWQKVGSTWNNVTAAMVAGGVITYTANKFTDQRDNKQVDCTELDVAKMYAQGFAPSNGVVYFSDDITSGSEWPALRLVNGSTLNAPLTVASQNPLYTKGNFNSVNKQPASLMADAITFLSSSFSDAASAASYTTRIAANTTVNCAYVTGDTPTTGTLFSGGFQNLPRFLESWTGKTFTWAGSAICLWNSVQANGNWTGGCYAPPNRVWSYDTMFNDPSKLPPSTPTVRVFQRTSWSEENVGGSN